MANEQPAPSAIERFLAKVRGNPVVATLLVVSTLVAGIASFTDAANKLVAPFRKQSPAAARTQLAQLNVPFTAEAFVASAASGDVTAVKLFLVAGMDANSIGEKQGSALGNAALRGRADVATLLLDAGARVVVTDDRPSALGSAAAGGHLELVRLMLDRQPAPAAEAIDEAFAMAASRYTFPQTRHYDRNEAAGRARGERAARGDPGLRGRVDARPRRRRRRARSRALFSISAPMSTASRDATGRA